MRLDFRAPGETAATADFNTVESAACDDGAMRILIVAIVACGARGLAGPAAASPTDERVMRALGSAAARQRAR